MSEKRKTIVMNDIEQARLKKAGEILGTRTDTETVRVIIADFIRRETK